MLTRFWAIIEIIRALFAFIKQWQEWQKQQKEKERIENQQKLDQALEELSKAQTDEEIYAAQEKIVKLRNSR